MAATAPKQPASDAVEERMKAHVLSLTRQYEDVKRDDSEEGRRQRAALGAQLGRLTHDQIHPGEEMVELDVPPAAMGEPFKINEEKYEGRVVVPACIAATLLWMIDQNRTVDINRMRESGRNYNMGVIGERARAISRDD